ncbi:MAG: hypothetical protein Q9223_007739 [Gallowayella weberi]
MHSFNLLPVALLLGTSLAAPFRSGSKAGITNHQKPIDETNVRWEKVVSGNGMAFEIGQHAATATTIDQVEKSCSQGTIAPTGKNDFGISVDWRLGSGSWNKPSESEQRTTGISDYSLHESSSPFYDYVLEFMNTETYDFHFYDHTGDSYEVNTGSLGSHLVRYNSDKPGIAFVTGN